MTDNDPDHPKETHPAKSFETSQVNSRAEPYLQVLYIKLCV